MIAIVDAGPLYAVTDLSDRDHDRCLVVLQRADLSLVIPTLVIGEVSYMIERRLGSRAESVFLRALGQMDVESPSPADWERIATLVEQYQDFPLGAVDASIVALAERLGTDLVVTLDERHFRAVRPRHCAAFHLLPT